MYMTETKNNTKTSHDGFKPKTVNRGGTPQTGGPRGKRPEGGARGQGPRKPRQQEERAPQEFDQKTLDIRRVTRVMAGGRRFSFAAAILIGDKKGRIGVGTGKSTDTTLAISKAVKNARKNLVTLPLTQAGSIAHEVTGKFNASRVWLAPNKGKGVVAGGALRDLIALAGIKNITGKVHSKSKNRLNNAKAAMAALATLSNKRGPKVGA